MTTQALGMFILAAPKKGLCPECNTKHEPWDAHDAQSLYYQLAFHQRHGRAPTWKDAIAHCDPQTQARWKAALEREGMWSEPPEALGKLPVVITERQQEETPVTPILMYGEGFDPREAVAMKECG